MCEIRLAAERIDVLVVQRIPADRVDREVAAPRGLFERHVRIADDGEALVAASGLRLAAGQRDVDRADLVDGEALADGLNAAETRQQRDQRVRREAEDLEVQILRREPQQPIADEAADDQRVTAGRARCRGDVVRELEWRTRGRHRQRGQ